MLFTPVQINKTKIFEYLQANQGSILCNASNYGNEGDDDMGLIPGHAYSVEGYEVIQGIEIAFRQSTQ